MSHANILHEIVSGEGLNLAQAAAIIPHHRGDRGQADRSCIHRWAKSGARSQSGEIIRLETALVGGRILTTKAALLRFLERLNDAPDAVDTPPSRPNTPQRDSVDRAISRLIKAGA
jgi:hypothetical protein